VVAAGDLVEEEMHFQGQATGRAHLVIGHVLGHRSSPLPAAQAGAEGFDGAIRLAEQQLPGARQMPGFKGCYLLTDAETGKLVIISLWETREQMDAVTAGAGPSGIREQHNLATAGLTAQHLETYEVTMHA
jgi:heme-degrading monooxygenase HmoA